ncbi:MAG: cytochrome c [Nitrospira sp.]|nr:cytochrome c [Nitrospira sp.]
MVKKLKGIPILAKVAVLLAVIYVGIKLIQPPLPSSLVMMYMLLASISVLIYISLFDDKSQEFFGPIVKFLAGATGRSAVMKYARLAVLVVFPLLVGMNVYARLVPSSEPPIEQRVVHPAPPGEFVGLSNPIPKTPENVQHGGSLYAVFCSPCHGGALDGKGAQSKGFNPPPANFRDPGTIAQLQESYLFWRIKNGGVGLPVEGQPWNSAMPRWGAMPARGGKAFTDDDIWKIILFEYEASGNRPRTWE